MRDRTGPETATVRNLEQIEEQSGRGPGANRLGAMVMASFGGACIVFCSLALVRSPADERARPADPLGELALASPAGAAKVKSAAELAPDDVSFPNVLSDHKDATTAMAAVRADHARNAALPSDTFGPLELGREPPLATDRLPVVPLPAQDILADHATPVGHADKLQGMAKQLSREQDNGELSSPGVPGGHQLQVSSFRTRAEAEVFTLALRRRGHKAHVEEAQVPMRGTWFRVKIGPFKFKRSAQLYREEFEAKERMVSFIVEPPKTNVRVEVTRSQPTDDAQDGAADKPVLRVTDSLSD